MRGVHDDASAAVEGAVKLTDVADGRPQHPRLSNRALVASDRGVRDRESRR